MWELDYKESWASKNWCFWTVVLEKTLESSLDCKEIQPVHPKGDQTWVFIGRTDFEAETPIRWPPDAKNWLIWKDPDAGKDWRQEEKGTTEYEMVGWHHRLNGHGFGWTPGVGDGQRGLACCDSWGHKESDTTEKLNWTEMMIRKHKTWSHSCSQVGRRQAAPSTIICDIWWFEFWSGLAAEALGPPSDLSGPPAEGSSCSSMLYCNTAVSFQKLWLHNSTAVPIFFSTRLQTSFSIMQSLSLRSPRHSLDPIGQCLPLRHQSPWSSREGEL